MEIPPKCCTRCGETKPADCFSMRAPGKLVAHCKECNAALHRMHYQRKREAYLARQARYRKRMTALVRAAKDVPCADCGCRFPHYVMDFDHRPGEKKEGVLVELIRQRGFGEQKLLAEIAKCDVVCANCHRIRTFKRLISTGESLLV